MFSERLKKNAWGLFILDAACLAAALAVSYYALQAGLAFMRQYDSISLRTYVLLLYLSFFVVTILQPPSRQILSDRFIKEIFRILRFNIVLTALFAALQMLFKSPLMESRYMLGYTIVFNVCLETVFHFIYKKVLLHAYADGSTARLLGVVTTSTRALEVLSGLKQDYTRKLETVVLMDECAMEDLPEALKSYPIAFGIQNLTDIILSSALDEVLFCLDYTRLEDLEGEIDEIKSMGVLVHLYVPLVDNYPGAERTVDMIGGCPVVTIAAKNLDPGALAVKRLCDILLGCIGLILSAPLILLVAGPLLLESKGPLFFSQNRVGRNGRVFRIYKLRSMYVDAEARKADLLGENEMKGPMFKIKDDPRITKVGRFLRKTSIDELPQLYNVVKGDMSIVGPRPPLMDEFSQYESRYKRRLSMRPGITGFWQVNGRNAVPEFEDVLKMDLAYIDNWSLALDIKILVKTVGVVLCMSGR
jgi:exopolysaccharide biosynthesis polyprenyl glycosylphosphotransferase